MNKAMTAGDLSKRADESMFKGVYYEIINGMNGLMESVANPLRRTDGDAKTPGGQRLHPEDGQGLYGHLG